jgi:hypothetical protein
LVLGVEWLYNDWVVLNNLTLNTFFQAFTYISILFIIIIILGLNTILHNADSKFNLW